MQPPRDPLTPFCIMPRRNLTVILVATIFSLACYHHPARNRYSALLSVSMNYIIDDYYKEVDPIRLFDAAMKGMVSSLDQNSLYYDRERMARLKEDLNQHFDGIGIGIDVDEDTGRLYVTTLIIGTPAIRAGIRAGDVILAVDGSDTEGWDTDDATEHLRGKAGESVRLTILHKGEDEPVELEIVRAVIPIESILGDTRRRDGTWEFVLEDHPRIGYIRMYNFGEVTSGEFTAAVSSIDGKVDGLIIDLRGNGGGLLPTSITVCDFFLDKGVIVTIRGRDGTVRTEYQASAATTIVDSSLPIALLIDKGSASDSEIVAACLQDHHRAVVVGDRSFGKGTVQHVLDLEGGIGTLKLTTATYWRPNGVNIHREEESTPEDDWGVQPDEGYRVPLSDEEIGRFYLQRRERDVVIGLDEDGRLIEVDDAEELDVEPPFDPQLQRAIEYVNETARDLTPAAAD